MPIEAQYNLKLLFPGLEEALYAELETQGTIKEVKAGDVLMRSGQPIRATMLVLEGAIRLYQEDADGGEFFIYHLQPGQACAISMVCGYGMGESHVTAKALTDAVLLSLPLNYMEDWMMRYRSWNQFVIRTYRSRFEELLQTVNAIAFKNMDERLEFYIKRHVQQLGKQVKLTHQEIANDLNSSREVVSRLLKKMEKEGWIVMHRNSFEWIRE